MVEEEESVKCRMIAKTYEGLEEVLAQELKELGAEEIKLLRRAVEFHGDLKMMYKANYWLRSAVNILKPIAAFEVEDEKDLYDKIYAIKWMNYFDLGKTFAVQATVNSHEKLTHSQYAALKVKDAIADQFRYYFNQRPDVDPKNANININVYISGKQCEVAINSSGMPLFKRGYKVEMHRAPLNEVLAAGMILLSGWDKNSNFIDPMCGSGTLLIEAALMAYNFPPQFMRRNFSFQYWSDYDRSLWREILSEDLAKQRDFEHRIIGGDISSKNLEIARHLITHMKFHKDIELVQSDIRDHKAPDDGQKGWIVTNPPYGERLHSKDLLGLYEKIGTAFKHNFPGYTASIISSDVEAMKMIGLKPIKKRELYNGGLLCKFNTYDLYEGSKKEKKKSDESDKSPEDSGEVAVSEEVENHIVNLFNDGSEMKDYDPLAHAKELEEKAARWEKQKEERKERWAKNKDEDIERKRSERRAKRNDREGGEDRDSFERREHRSKQGGGKREFKRELGKDHYNFRGGRASKERPEKSDWKEERFKRLKKQREQGRPASKSGKSFGETKGDDWKAKRFDRFKKRKEEEDLRKGSGDWKSKRRDDFKKENHKDGTSPSKPNEGRRSSFKRKREEDGEKSWGKKSSGTSSSRRDNFKKKRDDDKQPKRDKGDFKGKKGR